MMVVVPYRAEHLARVQAEPVSAGPSASLVTPAAAKALEGQYAWTAADNGVVLGCAGFAPKWLDHWQAWAFMSEASGPYMTAITKTILRMRGRWPRGRIEAAVDCDFSVGHRWLRLLGFEIEAERMRHYTPDGRDHALYAMVNM